MVTNLAQFAQYSPNYELSGVRTVSSPKSGVFMVSSTVVATL